MKRQWNRTSNHHKSRIRILIAAKYLALYFVGFHVVGRIAIARPRVGLKASHSSWRLLFPWVVCWCDIYGKTERWSGWQSKQTQLFVCCGAYLEPRSVWPCRYAVLWSFLILATDNWRMFRTSLLEGMPYIIHSLQLCINTWLHTTELRFFKKRKCNE